MSSVTARVSLGGTVLGMAHTAVNPPAAAARVPVAMSSLYSWPGSRRCVCRSMNPGTTHEPRTSSTRVDFGTPAASPAPKRPITPFSISRSPSASRLRAGSITRPPLRHRSISPGPLNRWSAGRSQPRNRVRRPARHPANIPPAEREPSAWDGRCPRWRWEDVFDASDHVGNGAGDTGGMCAPVGRGGGDPRRTWLDGPCRDSALAAERACFGGARERRQRGPHCALRGRPCERRRSRLRPARPDPARPRW